MEITPLQLQTIRSTLNTLIELTYGILEKQPNQTKEDLELLEEYKQSLLKNLDTLIVT